MPSVRGEEVIDEPYEPCDEDEQPVDTQSQPVDTQSHLNTSAPVHKVNTFNTLLESLMAR